MDTVHFVIDKPQRWDSSFDPEMSEEAVNRLLGIRPFSEMDVTKFSKRTPLRGILKNDTRIRRLRLLGLPGPLRSCAGCVEPRIARFDAGPPQIAAQRPV